MEALEGQDPVKPLMREKSAFTAQLTKSAVKVYHADDRDTFRSSVGSAIKRAF